MIHLRRLYNLDFNSALIRGVLGRYYKPGGFYTIPFGATRGIRLWYDRSINYHAILGLWEKENFLVLQKVLNKLLKKNDGIHVFDIGANIGLYSLFMARYSSMISVSAFEPVRETTRIFRMNINENKLSSIHLVEKAAGATDGQVTFYIGHHHKSSLEKDWTSDRGTTNVQEVQVPSTTIDSHIEQHPESNPDFIKIDVEGGGGYVFSGAINTLTKRRPIILIESHAAYEDRAIIQMLADFDYQAFRINNNQWVKNPKSDYKDQQGVWGTMLLFPEEKRPDYSNIL